MNRLGLCLAGGGIKGAAHIGALKVFEEEKIAFDFIAGTSSGSIVATLYACGYSSDEIYRLFQKNARKLKYIDCKNIFKIIWGILTKRKIVVNGLNSGEKIEKIIQEACFEKGIFHVDQVKKKLLIPAVNSANGKVYIFNSCQKHEQGNENVFVDHVKIGKAVRASCSFPVVFSPCRIGNDEFLDGGIKENVAWKELKEVGAETVLSIVFKNKKQKKCCESIVDVASRSIELLCDELSRQEMEGAGYVHQIVLDEVSLLEYKEMEKIYQEGYNQTKKKIKEIKEMLYQNREKQKSY